MGSLFKHCKLHLKCNDNLPTTAVVDAMGLSSPVAVRNTSLMHVAGKVDGALAFNGLTDYVAVAEHYQAIIRLGISVNVWVYHTRSDEDYIFGTRGTSGLCELALWACGGVMADVIGLQVSLAGDILFSDGLLAQNAWTMLTCVANQINSTQYTLSLYVNGVLDKTVTYTGSLLDYSNEYPLFIGGLNNGEAMVYPFSGNIDDFMLFDKPLTATEIEYLYNAGAGTETLPNCSISAVVEAAGVVTLTAAGDGLIDIYSRAAGAATWTLSLQDQAAGDIAVSGLTGGTLYEFYAVAHSGNQYSDPSNIMSLYLHDSTLPTISNVEAWAVGLLVAAGVFKTVDRWKHQIWLEKDGTVHGFDQYAPFAFLSEEPTAPEREGGYDLNRKIRLVIIVGQKSSVDGAARVGDATTVGTIELRDVIIAALENANPGEGFNCDDFYFTGGFEVMDAKRKHMVEMSFEADWIPTED